MNPCHHTIFSVTAKQVTVEGVPVPGLFTLLLRYRPKGEIQRLFSVHVPESLLRALETEDVAGLYVETLDTEGLPSRLLKSHPEAVLVGVATRDGREIAEMPSVLKRAWQVVSGCGIALCASSALLLSNGHPWVGALVLVAGAQCWRTSFQFPRLPQTRGA